MHNQQNLEDHQQRQDPLSQDLAAYGQKYERLRSNQELYNSGANQLPFQPTYFHQSNYFSHYQNHFPSCFSNTQVFMSYRTQNPQIVTQAPSKPSSENEGVASNTQNSKGAVKEEVAQGFQSRRDSYQIDSESASQDHYSDNRLKNPNYYWTNEQNIRYYQFVSSNLQWFRLKYAKRKNLRINVMMSDHMGSRTPVQCHSHHQKMMQKYKTVGNLLRKMKAQFERKEVPNKKTQEIQLQSKGRLKNDQNPHF